MKSTFTSNKALMPGYCSTWMFSGNSRTGQDSAVAIETSRLVGEFGRKDNCCSELWLMWWCLLQIALAGLAVAHQSKNTVTCFEGYKLVHSKKFKDGSKLSFDEAKDCKDVTVVQNGESCSCWRKISWQVQCEHELCIDNVFVPSKYSERWFSEGYLKENKLEFQCNPIAAVGLYPSSSAFHSPGGDFAAATVPYFESPPSAQRNYSEKLTYNDLTKRMIELARVVQHDQKAMRATMVAIEDIISMAQDKSLDFKVIRTAFCATDISTNTSRNAQVTNPATNPVPATSRNLMNFNNVRRKKAASEKTSSNVSQYGRLKRAPPTYANSDAIHISELQKVGTRTCSLCNAAGHRILNCPKITKYGIPLPRGNNTEAMKARNDFLFTLSDKFYMTSFMTDEENKKTLFEGRFPKEVSAMILHRRMFKSTERPFDVSTNYCFEVTLLDNLGNVKPDYEKAFLDLPLVNTFAARSRTNFIINLMRLEPKANSKFYAESPESATQSPLATPQNASHERINQKRCPHLAKLLEDSDENSPDDGKRPAKKGKVTGTI
jgi:hypothetical protein